MAERVAQNAQAAIGIVGNRAFEVRARGGGLRHDTVCIRDFQVQGDGRLTGCRGADTDLGVLVREHQARWPDLDLGVADTVVHQFVASYADGPGRVHWRAGVLADGCHGSQEDFRRELLCRSFNRAAR